MTEPTSTEHPEPELKTVFSTSEADLVPVIKSVLDSAKIPYVTEGEAMMNLFPSDLLGPTLHKSRGELVFRVHASRAEEARILLTEHSHVDGQELPAELAPKAKPEDPAI